MTLTLAARRWIKMLAMTSALFIAGTAHAQDDSFVAALDQQARTTQAGAARTGEPVRGIAGHTDWTTSLTPGSCYLLIGRAGAGVRKISLSLWAPDGRRVATEKPRGNTTSIRYCASWLGAYHVQAKIEGAGPYLVGTYVLPSGSSKIAPMPMDAPPPLVGSPSVIPPPAYAAPTYAQRVYAQPVYSQPVYVPAPVYDTPIYYPPERRTTVIIAPVIGGRGQDYCNSSIDCGSSEFCKADSSGVRVCMGKGVKGDACSSSIDCGFGMFCKDRGDDYNICM